MGEKRSVRLYLSDIIESITLIREYVHGLDPETFEKDTLVQDAVARRLEIIAEASKHIPPPELKGSQATIPWRSIQSMRNVMVHEYFGVQKIFVWRTVTEDLDELEVAVKAMLADTPEE